MGASSRRAWVLVGLGALACAFAGCEVLIGLNDFTVSDCSSGACEEGGAQESGADADASGDADASAGDSADVAVEARDTGSDGADASDAPDEGSSDVTVGPPDVAQPTVSEIWVQWVMPNPDAETYPGSDASLPNPMAYSYDGGTTVFDQRTGLTWEASGTEVTSYEDAEWHCARLTQPGSPSWRVPTRIELVSLIDWTHVPTLDLDAFAPDTDADTGQASGVYWSSSLAVPPTGGPLPADASPTSGWHWTVSFATGLVVQQQQLSAGWVRCVSGGS
jgi:hypothetical protein